VRSAYAFEPCDAQAMCEALADPTCPAKRMRSPVSPGAAARTQALRSRLGVIGRLPLPLQLLLAALAATATGACLRVTVHVLCRFRRRCCSAARPYRSVSTEEHTSIAQGGETQLGVLSDACESSAVVVFGRSATAAE